MEKDLQSQDTREKLDRKYFILWFTVNTGNKCCFFFFFDNPRK